jgi:hypothetical protein
MRLLILFIVLVVGSVGQNPLMHRHGFPNGVVDKRERRAEANACDVYVGSSGGQFYYFGLAVHGRLSLEVELMWTPNRRDLVAPSQMKRDITEFYGTTTNLPLPIVFAAIHSLMKAKKGHTGVARPVPQSGFETHRKLNGPPAGVWPPAWPRMDPNRGRSMRPATLCDATKWFGGNEAPVQETGKFYSHTANVLLPTMADIVYRSHEAECASARGQYGNQQVKEVPQ